MGSSEASPPTGGLYPDREGKDNAPLSLLYLPFLCQTPPSPPVLSGHLMWLYLIRKIILIVALFSLSAISPLQ